jgi:hypothetical protein
MIRSVGYQHWIIWRKVDRPKEYPSQIQTRLSRPTEASLESSRDHARSTTSMKVCQSGARISYRGPTRFVAHQTSHSFPILHIHLVCAPYLACAGAGLCQLTKLNLQNARVQIPYENLMVVTPTRKVSSVMGPLYSQDGSYNCYQLADQLSSSEIYHYA